MKIILDFDGTLTIEETQADQLAELSLSFLSGIFKTSVGNLRSEYRQTKAKLLAKPHEYHWEVNGMKASYCDEGAFILNTTTLQTLLSENPEYQQIISNQFQDGDYNPVSNCTNFLFHTFSAKLKPQFRKNAVELLNYLYSNPNTEPIVLTNSLGDKVSLLLNQLRLIHQPEILGDTRQYDLDPNWDHKFDHPELGEIQLWQIDDHHSVDLRRKVYYQALKRIASRDPIFVVADTFSLPGAVPLLMGHHFVLIKTSYTPQWCLDVTNTHPNGHVINDLWELKTIVEKITKHQVS